eukprot:6370946-Pyramimonas_sp.AAC.1
MTRTMRMTMTRMMRMTRSRSQDEDEDDEEDDDEDEVGVGVAGQLARPGALGARAAGQADANGAASEKAEVRGSRFEDRGGSRIEVSRIRASRVDFFGRVSEPSWSSGPPSGPPGAPRGTSGGRRRRSS